MENKEIMHFMEFKDFIENSYIHIKDLHHFRVGSISVQYRGRFF